MITLCLEAFVLEGREPSFLLSDSLLIILGVMCRIHHPRFKIITITLSRSDGAQRHLHFLRNLRRNFIMFALKKIQG